MGGLGSNGVGSRFPGGLNGAGTGQQGGSGLPLRGVSTPFGAAPGSPWFAVWTRSRHEQLVCTELAARHIEYFLPTYTQVSRWKDRLKRIAWPLFPGYCFVRIESAGVTTVLRCQGVVSVLSAAGRPLPVPVEEIESLQRLVASGLAFDPCPLIKTGSMVRVVKGPLAGVVGRLERKGAHDHLILAVNLLNNGARVQVSVADIRAL